MGLPSPAFMRSASMMGWDGALQQCSWVETPALCDASLVNALMSSSWALVKLKFDLLLPVSPQERS